MDDKLTEELREEKLYEMKMDTMEEITLRRSHSVFFDKFMDLYGDKLIDMRKYCDRYGWDFDLILDLAKEEI